ncbi:ABC transporter ATP-binding protein [Paenibacillus sp. CAA11]|uniref:ABC transporter ATP-binding protein n=1 Tax=Paenibacillus sp. CAA11 TaxID=1532905 RepID=UPI000D35440A|nr:ABC transporter ATP-binding protein [Paenibacillus sp. CAA11]AWB43332.1 ABC transporter ATP-binding protein [Paenibacillus sp. CAA11]
MSQINTVLKVQIHEAGYEPAETKIRNISFDVQPGSLTGLIGPNGAGKSTTIKTILGLMPYANAEIEFGDGTGTYAYVPEQPVFYETLTLWEHLSLAAAVNELDAESWEADATRLLERFRMTEAKHLLPGGFSKGMQQKMMLMLGFLVRPDVYIVDEPFIGLDPRATMDFLELLQEECRRGAGVLMSTHVLDTAERICEKFVLIHEGRVAAAGHLDEIRLQSGLPQATLFECFSALT